MDSGNPRGSEKTGVQVKNVYSGHGTYCTCGLTHWDPAVRRRFREQWMKPQADTARALEAGFGFYAHGFENSLLQDAVGYEARLEGGLYDDLAELARYAGEIGLSYIGLEQMYTPHMPPWTIDGAEELVRQVYARCGAAMYLTVDLGHMNGHVFPWPREEQILEAISRTRAGERLKRLWFGTEKAHEFFREAVVGKLSPEQAAAQILADAAEHPRAVFPTGGRQHRRMGGASGVLIRPFFICSSPTGFPRPTGPSARNTIAGAWFPGRLLWKVWAGPSPGRMRRACRLRWMRWP